MILRLALPLIALSAAACHETARPEPTPPVAGRCTAEGLDKLVGKQRSEAVAAEAKRLSGATRVRWITPGMMITMEYREDRVNLHVGVDGKIGSVRCG